MPFLTLPSSLSASEGAGGLPIVLTTGAETGQVFALVAVTLPPHDPGLPLHRHLSHAESCYVLAGTLALTQADCTTTVAAHTATLIPASVLHTFWNPTAEPTMLLLVYQPGVSEAEALALASGVVSTH